MHVETHSEGQERVGSLMKSGRAADVVHRLPLTRMYGPAVRCKRFSSIQQIRSCINVSGLWLERIALRAIMDISGRAI